MQQLTSHSKVRFGTGYVELRTFKNLSSMLNSWGGQTLNITVGSQIMYLIPHILLIMLKLFLCHMVAFEIYEGKHLCMLQVPDNRMFRRQRLGIQRLDIYAQFPGISEKTNSGLNGLWLAFLRHP